MVCTCVLSEWVIVPPLTAIVPLSRRCYSQEHGFRADTQTLLWDTPRLCTPEQRQHGTDIVAAVRNQRVLARPLFTLTSKSE